MSDEFDMSDDVEEGDAQWTSLDPTERKELLKNVFGDDNWYDGISFSDGGQSHPPFDEIAQRVGAEQSTIKKYYVAWLKARGFDIESIKTSMTASADPLATMTTSNTPAPAAKEPQPSSAYQQEVNRMQSEAFTPPAAASQEFSMQAPKGGSDSDSIFSMMQFLALQQRIASENQHRQMMMQMEQRRLDQQRESEIRRESQARDQQFNMQQMAFMREMMRSKDNDGFFDGDMKTIFKQRMVEQMLDGGSNSGALERIASRLLQPEMLGTLASAASNVMPTRNQVPAGYDSPNYDPYAQPQNIQQNPAPVAQPQAPQDNFFEGPEEPQPQAEPDIDVTSDQYKHALLEQFKQIMGPELEDPKTLSAVQEQIDITVDNVVVEFDPLSPQGKLDKMAERMVLVRSLRDIGRGMQDAMAKIEEGTDPDLVYAFVVGELKKNEVFWNIFRTHTYDELMALIAPYKETGGVVHDYNFLLRPEVAGVCREMLKRVKAA